MLATLVIEEEKWGAGRKGGGKKGGGRKKEAREVSWNFANPGTDDSSTDNHKMPVEAQAWKGDIETNLGRPPFLPSAGSMLSFLRPAPQAQLTHRVSGGVGGGGGSYRQQAAGSKEDLVEEGGTRNRG